MEPKKPPDGGWGWVIVVASFFTQFLCYGSPLAVGVLYIEWLDVYKEGKGKTAWVGSLANGVGLILSPLCSLCVQSFGVRPVTIFSGFMVAGGLMLSSVAPNIYFLYFAYGVIVGLGCGLLYTASVTIICQYFDKRRGLALGLVSTGSSIGIFIYAALQLELVQLYGLDGCLLIVGALGLNILPCGILMRPLGPSDCPQPEKAPVESVSAQYSIYKEKEKVPEEHISMLEKGYSEEKFGSPLVTSDSNRESPFHEKEVATVQTKETEVYKKKESEQKNFCKQLAKKNWQRCQNYWTETVSLFKNRVFSALFIAILLLDIGAFPPLLLMEDVARSANVPDEDFVIPLVAVLGIMTAIGKFLLGVLADLKFINTLYLYVGTLILTSMTLCAIPFAKSYLGLAVLSGLIGFFTGNWSIFPYNYDIAFYFCGLCVLIGGVVLLLAALPWGNMCHRDSAKPAPKPYVYQAASNA
uniref:Solute carrier family 16 member 9 n=1 Tax=Monodelphis domestica TaxID=13616 RepID=F7FZ70_MONDO